jgi:hypothetical protein
MRKQDLDLWSRMANQVKGVKADMLFMDVEGGKGAGEQTER